MARNNSKHSSVLWEFFQKLDNSDKKAKCKTCYEVYSYKTSTANLKAHLKRKHLDAFERVSSAQTRAKSLAANCGEDVAEQHAAVLLSISNCNGAFASTSTTKIPGTTDSDTGVAEISDVRTVENCNFDSASSIAHSFISEKQMNLKYEEPEEFKYLNVHQLKRVCLIKQIQAAEENKRAAEAQKRAAAAQEKTALRMEKYYKSKSQYEFT